MFAGQMVGHAMGRNTTEATAVAQDQLEQIYLLPFANVTSQAAVDCQTGTQGWDCVVAPGGGGCPPAATPYRRQTAVTENPLGFPPGARLITVTVQWCDDISALHNIMVSGIRTAVY
jgi:hypothetical protein